MVWSSQDSAICPLLHPLYALVRTSDHPNFLMPPPPLPLPPSSRPAPPSPSPHPADPPPLSLPPSHEPRDDWPTLTVQRPGVKECRPFPPGAPPQCTPRFHFTSDVKCALHSRNKENDGAASAGAGGTSTQTCTAQADHQWAVQQCRRMVKSRWSHPQGRTAHDNRSDDTGLFFPVSRQPLPQGAPLKGNVALSPSFSSGPFSVLASGSMCY